MARKIALMNHAWRDDVAESAAEFRRQIEAAGIQVLDARKEKIDSTVELIVVFGGDGTILHAAEIARGQQTPILGINYGHVGFLAEVDSDSFDEVVRVIKEHAWTVDSRMTIDVSVTTKEGHTSYGWALNEISIEKTPPAKMIETGVAVDGRAVSTFKTDGIVFSTPTGSTAYNFSAGGPIVWPDVEAMTLVPIAAHALFTRPMVVAPDSEIEVYILSDQAQVSCDGRRIIEAPEGASIIATKGNERVNLVRIDDAPFSERLVAKFRLPVDGWRATPGTGGTP
ncbi:NAD kinase [Arcanobacterium hippocoleae]